MSRWQRKPEQPLDRAMREVEDDLARIKRELRSAASTPAMAERPAARPARGRRRKPHAAAPASVTDAVGTFMKQMLRPASRNQAPTYRTQHDLFDVAGTPTQQLEMDEFAFGDAPGDAVELPEPAGRAAAAPETERTAGAARPSAAPASRDPNQSSKLVHYLSAGGIRSYKPLRRVQREDRNRFFTWIAMAGVAVWLLYVVIR